MGEGDGVDVLDQGKPFDWGKTSDDYAMHRPGPPLGLYTRLAALGIGLPGQRVLDIATGTGVLARQLAQQGCEVTGIDISPEQISIARSLAAGDGLAATFLVGDAHRLPFSDDSFDVVIASQCWWYFDVSVLLPEIARVLQNRETLVVTHFNYLPRMDPVAAASEQLILRYNPQWSGANWPVEVPPCPKWAEGRMHVKGMFYFDEDVPFTRESWRGRMRACRGVGASLAPDLIDAFDREHDALLQNLVSDKFTIRHRIDAHILEFS